MTTCLRKTRLTANTVSGGQRGYVLITVMVVLMIVGIMANNSMDVSISSEHIAGNAIQRSRAFQAADGAHALAQAELEQMLLNRVVADDTATNGIFTRTSTNDKWWQQSSFSGEHQVSGNPIAGVVEQPRYVIEEVGQYVTDGGTGIVSLDIGGAAYGRRTTGGRNVVLYTIESHGKGSFDNVQSVIESTVALSY
jgi:Tfp pilus assembly protein PilX